MSKYFKCETNKDALSYAVGERIVFTIAAKNNMVDIPCAYIHWKLAGDDGKQTEGLGACKPGQPLVLETSLDKPGFVHLTCTAYSSSGVIDNSFDVLDAGAGADVEQIAYCDTMPDDFNAYWNDIEQLVADFDYELLLFQPVTVGIPEGYQAFELRISTPAGRPASGFVTMPEASGKYPILITFNGYGLSAAAAGYNPNTITAHFNAHGFENDLEPIELKTKYYHELVRNKNGYSYGFDPEENCSNMATYWRNMMIRNLISLKYLKSLPAWDGRNITASGGSQAALQATTLAAHDKDVTFLRINIPWFCNLKAEQNGYLAGWRPCFAEGLRYFDTVAQATRVKCPVVITARLGDYVCPPSTIMALYNSFTCSKQLCFVQSGTHGYNPPEWEAFYRWHHPELADHEFAPGLYRHYKGGEYRLLHTARNSETPSEWQVVYQSTSDGVVWVRPAHMWNELVFDGKNYVRRFQLIR